MNSIDDRLDFLGITQEDRQILREFKTDFEKIIDPLLESFYKKILSIPELAQKFPSNVSINRAKTAQREHWLRMFSAEFDDEYYKSSREIGLTHSRIGLDPRWYIGGYSLVLADLIQAVVTRSGFFGRRDIEREHKLRSAICRVVLLDTELALSVYLDEEKAVHQRFVEAISNEFSLSVVHIVTELVDEAGQIGTEANQLHDAAETACSQANTVVEATKNTNVNVQMVASSVEEMSVAIQEVSSHLARQVRVSAQAMENGQIADRNARSLTECAERIGKAVGLIRDIATQTNLLALNATIEAARAGEAGKGFAVVAGEVNALSSQVARTTEDIRLLVDEVRSVAAATVQAIQKVNGTLEEMDQATGAIAAAVEEQSVATRNISENVQQAAHSTQTVTDAIDQVRDIVSFTEQCANDTKSGLTSLSGRAELVNGQVKRFVEKLTA